MSNAALSVDAYRPTYPQSVFDDSASNFCHLRVFEWHAYLINSCVIY